MSVHEYLNTGPHVHPIFDDRTLARCPRCDSMWCPQPPSLQELSGYYATSYTPARMGPMAGDQWPIWDTRAASLIMLARLFTEWQPGDRFVDVGPGNGAALSLAPLMLKRPRLGCVEFATESIAYFRRHTRLKVARGMDRFEDESVRIVYSAHSLEHFRPEDVLGGLREIRRTLVPGGVLTLEVPYNPSRRTLAAWRHPPHLLFFSRPGLIRLLERAGFEVPFSCVAKGRQATAEMRVLLATAEGVPYGIRRKLPALNTGDLAASVDRADAPVRGVLKVVARRPIQT